jgi:hypothetical protein
VQERRAIEERAIAAERERIEHRLDRYVSTAQTGYITVAAVRLMVNDPPETPIAPEKA